MKEHDECMDALPVPRLTLTTLLTCYVAGLVGIRAQQTPNYTHTHILTTCAFFLVAWILARRGGTSRWPTLLPLAIAQGIGLLGYMVYTARAKPSATDSKEEEAWPFDAIVAVLTAGLATGIMLYGIVPSTERWARHVGVIACVLCGLPMALLIPSMRRVAQTSTTPETMALIRRAARASNAVYARTQGDAERADFFHNPSTGARCGIFVVDAGVVVAFSGSDSKVDWVRTNVNVGVEPIGSLESVRTCDGVRGAVHKGVLDAWKSIRDEVWTAVSNLALLRGGSGSIVVCGHSLGGAMATVAAMDLACQLDRTPISLVTFGSPPVGDAAFVRSVASAVPTSFRVTTVSDPVPKLAIRNFVHVETEYPVVTSVENPVTAHFMASYLRAIEAPSGTLGISRLAGTVGGAMALLGLSCVVAWKQTGSQGS